MSERPKSSSASICIAFFLYFTMLASCRVAFEVSDIGDAVERGCPVGKTASEGK